MQLHLFRIRLFGPKQPSLLEGEFIPQLVLERAIEERPSSALRRGVVWHIGNIQQVDETGLYFRLGKLSRARLSTVDEASGDFIEEEVDNAPYTHCVLDLPSEVCAVAQSFDLAPTPIALAGRLADVLRASQSLQAAHGALSVDPIRDPEEFIELLSSAHAVKSFTYSFRRPNPFDVDRDFVEPFEKLTKETTADNGNVTVKGPSLAPEPLTAIARSAAATGDDAKARIQLAPRASTIVRSLKTHSASVVVPEVDTAAGKSEALRAIRIEYERVRKGRS